MRPVISAVIAIAIAAGLVLTPTGSAVARSDSKQKPAAGKGPARPLGDWRVGAVSTQAGAFAYCVAENRFDNGLALIIGRNPAQEINLAIILPKGTLKADQTWPVTLTIDGVLKRSRKAVAASADLVVLPMGQDRALLKALGAGYKMDVQGPDDTASFLLKGSTKALNDLSQCVEDGQAGGNVAAPRSSGAKAAPSGTNKAEGDKGEGKAGKTAADAKTARMPEPLAALLAKAGLHGIAPLALRPDLPEDKRPADFAWSYGPVFGGVRERQVPGDRDLAALSTAYVDSLKKNCTDKFTNTLDAVETINGTAVRKGTVSCAMKKDRIHVALLFYLTKTRLFTVLFHEAAIKDRAVADRARDSLMTVIRELAGNEPAR